MEIFFNNRFTFFHVWWGWLILVLILLILHPFHRFRLTLPAFSCFLLTSPILHVLHDLESLWNSSLHTELPIRCCWAVLWLPGIDMSRLTSGVTDLRFYKCWRCQNQLTCTCSLEACTWRQKWSKQQEIGAYWSKKCRFCRVSLTKLVL